MPTGLANPDCIVWLLFAPTEKRSMSKTYPDNTLVVVADGNQAMLFSNHSGDGSLKLKKTADLSPKDLADDGPAGSRPKESSPQSTDEATFAKQLAEYLNRQAVQGKVPAIVLVADPQTLGQIRPSLHQKVVDKLVQEVDKTLTNSPVADIERSIGANA